jgi:hypothetical protein
MSRLSKGQLSTRQQKKAKTPVVGLFGFCLVFIIFQDKRHV